ncbi:hypothetical protein HWV62_40840 [Athelia sp. TMB]|nr:hypothetical protein HWV62_40840 [Athelia sp. TMB]
MHQRNGPAPSVTRETRSGRAFNPWMIGADTLSAAPTAGFDFGKLLQAAVCRESATPAVDARPIDDAALFPVGDAGDGACGGVFDRAADEVDESAPGDVFERAYGRPCEYGLDEGEGEPAYGAGGRLSERAPLPAPPRPTLAQHLAEPSGAARPPAAMGPAPSAPSAKAWKAARNKRCGKEREARRREARTHGVCVETRAFLSRHLSTHEPLAADFMAAEMPHVATAYQGVRDSGAAKRLWTVEECVSIWGHVVKKWDGKAPELLFPSWTAWAVFSASAQEGLTTQAGMKHIERLQRSSRMPAANAASQKAVAHTVAVTFRPLPKESPLVADKSTLGLLFRRYPLLKQNFKNSVFPCATVNFGPQTCCFPHTDANNLPYGLCAITALGSFNPTLGGHLILWDLKLVIEFPPGATILIPSATVQHSNTPIQEGETRYSFTQYAAGGLFRWVEHGFQTERSRTAGWSRAQVEEDKAKGERRWEDGIKLFSTLDELRSVRSRK